MISAQPNKPQQEKLIGKLMELPNNAVRLSSSNILTNHGSASPLL
jgi:exportin-1